MARWPKTPVVNETCISAECVCSISCDIELIGLAVCASSPISNRTLIGHRDLAAANSWSPDGKCSSVRLQLGWLSDIEQWRDISTSKIVHAWAKPTPAVCLICRSHCFNVWVWNGFTWKIDYAVFSRSTQTRKGSMTQRQIRGINHFCFCNPDIETVFSETRRGVSVFENYRCLPCGAIDSWGVIREGHAGRYNYKSEVWEFNIYLT